VIEANDDSLRLIGITSKSTLNPAASILLSQADGAHQYFDAGMTIRIKATVGMSVKNAQGAASMPKVSDAGT